MFFHMVYKSGQIFLPFCHNPRVWRTDRQTDRQTDRILIAGPRLHYMQRGENSSIVQVPVLCMQVQVPVPVAYSKNVLKYNLSTSTSTKYNKTDY